MGLLYSSYYGFIRVNNAGPQIKNWAVTDTNWDAVSMVLKAMEQHQHGGSTPIHYPGYNYATPATPVYPHLALATPGYLSPGTTIGVRLSYLDPHGLETAGSPEIDVITPAIPDRPDSPAVGLPTSTPVFGAIPGGTFVYGVTKRQGTGETMLSNTAVVDVPFSQTGSYTVGLTFANIGSYTDGTDSLLIYRSQGYNTAFQLLTTITDPNATTYTDINSLADPNQSPPSVNQFGKNLGVNIDWSQFAHPSSAIALKVYVTQTPALWGTQNLLMIWPMNDPSTPLPSSMSYLGNEILGLDYPKEFSQIPGNPPKVYLTNQAYGAPTLTEPMNFAGNQARNFILANNINNATPLPGGMYYEPSMATPAVRVWVDTSTATPGLRSPLGWQTLAPVGGTYTHPVQEQGGHSANNILFNQQGGPTSGQILSVIATPVTPFRKQVTKIQKAVLAGNQQTSSAALGALAGMSITLTPDFQGQWCETKFNQNILVDPKGAPSATVSCQLVIDGSISQGSETYRSFTAAATPSYVPLSINFSTPLTGVSTMAVNWLVSNGAATAVGGQGSVVGKILF